MNRLSVWGKGKKIARRGKGGEPVDKQLGPLFRPPDAIADHLSARSLLVTLICFSSISSLV